MQIVHLFLTDRILGAWDRSGGCPSSCTFSGPKSSVLGDCSRWRLGGRLSEKCEESVEPGSRAPVAGVRCGPAPAGARALPCALSLAVRASPAGSLRAASRGLGFLSRLDTLCFEGDGRFCCGVGGVTGPSLFLAGKR